jgi:hypothetical protein
VIVGIEVINGINDIRRPNNQGSRRDNLKAVPINGIPPLYVRIALRIRAHNRDGLYLLFGKEET